METQERDIYEQSVDGDIDHDLRKREKHFIARRELRRALRASMVERAVRSIVKIDTETLVTQAIEYYNNYVRDLYGRPALRSSQWEFLCTLQVNYLRHVMSPYDEDLTQLSALYQGKAARRVLKTRINRRIAALYPHLVQECERQIAHMDVVDDCDTWPPVWFRYRLRNETQARGLKR